MSDVESSDEGFQMERRVSQAETEITDPFAIATKKKVSYGTFASMGTSEKSIKEERKMSDKVRSTFGYFSLPYFSIPHRQFQSNPCSLSSK